MELLDKQNALKSHELINVTNLLISFVSFNNNSAQNSECCTMNQFQEMEAVSGSWWSS